MSFLDRIYSCNNADTSGYLPCLIDDRQAGWVKPAFVCHLEAWPEVFRVSDTAVEITPGIKDFNQRTAAVDAVMRKLADEAQIRSYLDEPYPVTDGDRKHTMMTIDRGAVPYFGIRSFGQHLNGYVRKDDGIYLWIGTRARDRLVEPGKLDNMVAGGLPWHTSLQNNLIKECAEEAGMDEALATRAIPAGTVSYLAESPIGIKPDTLYCYDIELPEDFTPVCTDGEVESFALMHIDQVISIVRDTEDFKPNCNLVIIDFLVRHGLLDPDQEGYAEIVSSLHKQL